MGKLINRIPGSRLLISSLLGSAFRTHVESLGKPCEVNKRSKKPLPGKLDIKSHSPSILFFSRCGSKHDEQGNYIYKSHENVRNNCNHRKHVRCKTGELFKYSISPSKIVISMQKASLNYMYRDNTRDQFLYFNYPIT